MSAAKATTDSEHDYGDDLDAIVMSMGSDSEVSLKGTNGDTDKAAEHLLSNEATNEEEDSKLHALHVPWTNVNEVRKSAPPFPDFTADSEEGGQAKRCAITGQAKRCAVDIRFWRRERKVQKDEEDSKVQAAHIPGAWVDPNKQQGDSLKKDNVASTKGLKGTGVLSDGHDIHTVDSSDAPGATRVVGPGGARTISSADTIVYDAPGLHTSRTCKSPTLYETEARLVENELDTSFLLKRIRELEEGQQRQVVATAEAVVEVPRSNEEESMTIASDKSASHGDTKTWRARAWWIVLLVSFAFLVAAVIVGVVFGTKRDQTSNNPNAAIVGDNQDRQIESSVPTVAPILPPTGDAVGTSTESPEMTTPASTSFPISKPPASTSSTAEPPSPSPVPTVMRLTASPSLAPLNPPTPVPTTLLPNTNPPTESQTLPTLPPTTQSPTVSPTAAPILSTDTIPPTNPSAPASILPPNTNPPTDPPTLPPTTEPPTVSLSPALILPPDADPPTDPPMPVPTLPLTTNPPTHPQTLPPTTQPTTMNPLTPVPTFLAAAVPPTLVPPFNPSICPVEEPDVDSLCLSLQEGVRCTYGDECCCAECFESIIPVCDCFNGTWFCIDADACLVDIVCPPTPVPSSAIPAPPEPEP